MKISLPSFRASTKNLHRWEQKALGVLGIFGVAALLVLAVYQFGARNLEPASGGFYKEGLVGTVRYLNPVLASINENDRTVVPLLYSGLMRYDENGELVPDLAERFAIGELGKVYEFFLREDATWHDGRPVTADDVVFTVTRIQNADYQSPLRFSWEGVAVEKVDRYTVRFNLVDPYAYFLDNATVGILPKHLWENIDPLTFPLAELNLKPIGSGPFMMDVITRNEDGTIKSMNFIRNQRYYRRLPYLDKVTFQFFATNEDLFAALNNGTIEGAGNLLPVQFTEFSDTRGQKQQVLLPRYFALFFNQANNAQLSDVKVRTALSRAINKELLVSEVFRNQAETASSPIPKAARYHNAKIELPGFDTNVASELFATYDEPPSFKITTLKDPDLLAVAAYIQDAWEAVGARVQIETKNAIELRDDVIKNRSFEILLFGQSLKRNPDPFSFWHSSQKTAPGFNLSQYENTEVDRLLEDARQIFDDSVRQQKLENFQELLLNDMPAIFLYSPYYLYILNNKIKGVNVNTMSGADERFFLLPDWYINVRRTF